MSPRTSTVALAAAALVALTGCARHEGILAPTIKDPVVFEDRFGSYVDFQAFAGSKLDAIAIDSTDSHSGVASLRVTVPAPGSPGGTYAGGAITTNRARDLSGYDAITFWAKADHAITFDVVGIGNDNTGTSKYTASRSSLPMTTSWTRYVVPLPLASRLTDEKGLFYFAEGPEAGQGATVWFDEIQFENLLTVTDPRPSFPTQTLTPDVGSDVTVPGTKVTFNVDGTDQVVDCMQGYFTFVSSADSVAVGGEGTLRAVGLGSATVTGALGGIPAAGVLTVTPNAAPQSAAPAPTVPAANVISLFSNAYTNVPVDTWSASWDIADVADVQIAGNDVKRYSNLVYAGVEFVTHEIDATGMTDLHLDVWIPHGTNFKVKLVDFGADGVYGGGNDTQYELTFTSGSTPALAIGSWSGLEIPLSSFTGLASRSHLAQLVLSGDPGTAYVDNVYFHD
jgi:hypothetical protein